MNEPKYPKFENKKKENDNYHFFEEGIFPEKKQKNKSSQKKIQRPNFSLPNEINKKKLPNTQNDDELVPFFAKDYPSSSESKEDICLINSPIPSNTVSYSGGEAEEVEVIEEENEEQSQIKKKINNDKIKNNNINNKNDESGNSIDFYSDLEEEQDRPSKMMSREEVIERIKIQKEKMREEKRKKEEEEKRKKEEEEKRKKEEIEKMKKIQEEKTKKMIEEKKRKEKEEQERKRKELEKRKKEEERKKKEIERQK